MRSENHEFPLLISFFNSEKYAYQRTVHGSQSTANGFPLVRFPVKIREHQNDLVDQPDAHAGFRYSVHQH